MVKKSLGATIKDDFKQGLGDAADTLLRTPTRVAGMMGLKQSKGNRSPNNKGEQAAKDLWSRASNAGKAFAKSPSKTVSNRKVALKK